MVLPKNDIKYKSVKRLKLGGRDRLEKTVQLMCYKGQFSLKCNNRRHMCRNCWFNGLKPDKE